MKYTNGQCAGITKTGAQCPKGAMADSDYCYQHAVGAEGWRQTARNAAAASAATKRARKTTRPRSGFAPAVTLEQVFELASQGLTATFADADLPGEIDWSTRLLACLVILHTFAIKERRTPEQTQALLKTALPRQLHEDPQAGLQLKAQRVYLNARREWDKLRLRYSPLTGLYVDAYPSWLIAPWEDTEKVQAERPATIPPLEAQKRLQALPDGKYAMAREGELPLIVSAE